MTAPLPRRPRIAVVDYGAGNLVSMDQALDRVGAEVVFARDAEAFRDIDAIVVPGVGAAGPAMERLRRRGLADPIVAWIAAGRPLLGICLGFQLLFEASDEDGAQTLGVIPGRTRRLADAPTLPHIGWNQVDRVRDHPLFDGIAPGADFYFVHSFAGVPHPTTAADVPLAHTTHGGTFVSAIARDNVLGVQFHPERSGADGLRLLANAVELVRSGGFDASRAHDARSLASDPVAV
jgi:imidazole glycerol-phosphate synthase subunit HisH